MTQRPESESSSSENKTEIDISEKDFYRFCMAFFEDLEKDLNLKIAKIQEIRGTYLEYTRVNGLEAVEGFLEQFMQEGDEDVSNEEFSGYSSASYQPLDLAKRLNEKNEIFDEKERIERESKVVLNKLKKAMVEENNADVRFLSEIDKYLPLASKLIKLLVRKKSAAASKLMRDLIQNKNRKEVSVWWNDFLIVLQNLGILKIVKTKRGIKVFLNE